MDSAKTIRAGLVVLLGLVDCRSRYFAKRRLLMIYLEGQIGSVCVSQEPEVVSVKLRDSVDLASGLDSSYAQRVTG